MKICPICQKEFESHNGMQKFCSANCTNIARNNRRNKHSREELSSQFVRKCLVCETEFEVDSLRYSKKYCCDECRRKAERIFGNKREIDLDYKNKIRYGGNQFKVLKRDNYSCQICGNTLQLVVHHKDKSGQCNNPNNDIDNLVTLCRRCHINIHKF